MVDGAIALTGSRYGVTIIFDGSSRPPDFDICEITDEERRRLKNFMPGGLLVYQFLSALEEPLRVSDSQGHLSSLGLLGLTSYRPVLACWSTRLDNNQEPSCFGSNWRRNDTSAIVIVG